MKNKTTDKMTHPLSNHTVQNLFAQFVRNLQDEITSEIKKVDPTIQITEDLWERADDQGQQGGGGRTRAFKGKIFENAGVNTSLVFGAANEHFLKRETERVGAPLNNQMWATGISLIIHPLNPRVPTVHMNFRLLEVGGRWWFGGGADLTPFYPYEEDFQYFHQVWKKACSQSGRSVYAEFKKNCDEYFVNHHRGQEMRGIGGIFFDFYNTGDMASDSEFVQGLGRSFIESYFPLVKKRMNDAYDSEDEDFQLHRHGRYVEFNLLHDRGTHFGLKTNGRTESILISLPHRCKFSYNYRPKVGSIHEKMMSYYFPREWV